MVSSAGMSGAGDPPSLVPPTQVPLAPASPPAGRTWARALARRGSWWWVPLVISALFTASVAVWLEHSDASDLEERQRQLISDSLSLESQVSERVAAEQQRVETLARNFDPVEGTGGLARQPAVMDGLSRLWQSVAWVDAETRLRDLVPEQADTSERPGLSAHLSAPVKDWEGRPMGRLVVRYSPSLLLRQAVPWWLSHEYEVRLVDGFGQVIADPFGSGSGPSDDPGVTHRHSLEPAMPDTYLELSMRDPPRPWWLRLPIVLMGVFLALIAAATALLRWQMNEILRTEAALRTETAWRRAMEDSLTVGLRARDASGRLVYCNRAFCDLVGFAPEELVGHSSPMPYWPPDAIADSMSRHLRNLAGGAPREGYEARWLRSDGRPIDVMIFEAPLVDAGGRQIGWMGSILDITERKQLEERERRRTEAVAHQARLTMLGEVASALAHQLNQPLTSISGYAAGVKRLLERAGQPDTRLVDAMGRLADQAAEAGRIVKRIREFLTRRSPQREPTDLGAAAHRALGLLAREMRRLAVQVEWAIPPALPEVDADPVLIEQVVLNLVRNACDEMAGLPAAERRLRISVSALRDGETTAWLRLDVEDGGPGLRGVAVDQLVTPFYSTKPEGMGMGLAICRSIVEAHHGTFDAGDSPLGGARFSFTLPVASPEGQREDLAAPPESSVSSEASEP